MIKRIQSIGLATVICVSALFIQSCSSKASNTEVKEESCCSSTKENVLAESSCCSKTQEESQLTVYYFHATRRCATCQAVEKVTKEYIEANYAGKVNFISVNREEDQNKDLVEKYEIAGQTLLIVDNNEVINLTNEAFLNARSNPEKLEEILKTNIESHI